MIKCLTKKTRLYGLDIRQNNLSRDRGDIFGRIYMIGILMIRSIRKYRHQIYERS